MKKVSRLAAVSLALCLSVGVRQAGAWGKTWIGTALEQAAAAAKWKLGRLRISPVFILADAGYDTNLYYGHAGEPVKDYTLTLGPGLTGYLPLSKKIIFEVYESPQYVYFNKTRHERTWNNYFSAKAHFALNRFFITIGRGLTDARQRWSTEVDIRPRRKQDSWDGLILWQATKKTSFMVQGTRMTFRYEDLAFGSFNIRDRLDRTEDRLGFRILYQMTYRTGLFLEAVYGDYRFAKSVSSFKNSRSYGLYGGFEFVPSGTVRGRINLGYKVLEPRDPRIARYKGLAGDSRVSIRLLRPLRIRLSYSRDIQFSVWYNSIYFLESRAGAGASLYVSRRIRLDYDYTDGRNRYPESQFIGPGVDIKRRDDYRIHSVGLYFRLKNNLGLGLVASRWKRDSNLIWEIDNRDFFGMNLIYDF